MILRGASIIERILHPKPSNLTPKPMPCLEWC